MIAIISPIGLIVGLLGGAAYNESLKRQLNEKDRDSVIVANGASTLEHTLRWRQELCPGIPIVLVGQKMSEICKRVAELPERSAIVYSGVFSIWAENQTGGGAAFRFTLCRWLHRRCDCRAGFMSLTMTPPFVPR